MMINQFTAGEGQKAQTSKGFKKILRKLKPLSSSKTIDPQKIFFPLLMQLLQIIPKD